MAESDSTHTLVAALDATHIGVDATNTTHTLVAATETPYTKKFHCTGALALFYTPFQMSKAQFNKFRKAKRVNSKQCNKGEMLRKK